MTDWKCDDGGTICMHHFLTGREVDGVKPVFGLTANILIHIAISGYGRGPDSEFQPPDAPTRAQQIARALLSPTNPLRLACEHEGIDADKMASCVLHLLKELNSEHRMMEWEKIDQDWRRTMETCAWPNKGIVLSSSETEEPIQQRVDIHDAIGREDIMRKEMQECCPEGGEDVNSDFTGGLNQRKEHVGEEKQLVEQGKSKVGCPSTSTRCTMW